MVDKQRLRTAYEAGVAAGKNFDLTNPDYETIAERIEFRRGWLHGLLKRDERK